MRSQKLFCSLSHRCLFVRFFFANNFRIFPTRKVFSRYIFTLRFERMTVTSRTLSVACFRLNLSYGFRSFLFHSRFPSAIWLLLSAVCCCCWPIELLCIQNEGFNCDFGIDFDRLRWHRANRYLPIGDAVPSARLGIRSVRAPGRQFRVLFRGGTSIPDRFPVHIQCEYTPLRPQISRNAPRVTEIISDARRVRLMLNRSAA